MHIQSKHDISLVKPRSDKALTSPVQQSFSHAMNQLNDVAISDALYILFHVHSITNNVNILHHLSYKQFCLLTSQPLKT